MDISPTHVQFICNYAYLPINKFEYVNFLSNLMLILYVFDFKSIGWIETFLTCI